METFIIAIASFTASLLTFFSGFGLGTILTPVFMFFFPIDLAIALTGVVHFLNSLFKLTLVGKNADKSVLVRFGIPAVLASIIGAFLLLRISTTPPLFSYELFNREYSVSTVKFVISALLICFVILDLIPMFNKLQFGQEKLPLGGLLSGFFGGLSGNQGALRSAFLVKAGLSKEAFIATGVVISCFVDFTRLSIYATRFSKAGLIDNMLLVTIATCSAFSGAYLGNRLLKKVTFKFIQILVAVLLLLVSIALGAGFI